VGLERTANFFSRHARKLQIKHHHAGSLPAKTFQAYFAVSGNLDRKSVRLEQTLKRTLHWPTILDN
jgi:hypothetical protein